MWEILQDKLNAANILQMQETADQYWETRMCGLRCYLKKFLN